MSDLQLQSSKIGFMQGRLSSLVDGKIQAFPWDDWRLEFAEADTLGIRIMEWTLDQENLRSNPMMTERGREEIKLLCQKFNLSIPSLTGDCFMQSPFWKAKDKDKSALEEDFISIISSCEKLGIKFIVVPLVDNGSIKNDQHLNSLFSFFNRIDNILRENSVNIIFESDYEPLKLKDFIDNLDPKFYGINYDIGNSAALGFNPIEEFLAYGDRIMNVHVKDRPLGGTTVPLGEGDANLALVFKLLKEYSYEGNYILQTARSSSGKHSLVLEGYKNQVINWLLENR